MGIYFWFPVCTAILAGVFTSLGGEFHHIDPRSSTRMRVSGWVIFLVAVLASSADTPPSSLSPLEYASELTGLLGTLASPLAKTLLAMLLDALFELLMYSIGAGIIGGFSALVYLIRYRFLERGEIQDLYP